MTAQSDPYVRVYYSIIDDERFADVYDDDASLALWLRLLLTADAMHPAPSPLPFGIRKSALARLVKAGIVELITGNRYRIHGLDAERAKRHRQAVDAGKTRAANAQREGGRFTSASPPIAGDAHHRPLVEPHQRPPTSGHQLSETRRDETSNSETRRADARPPENGVSPEIQTLQGLAEELTGQAFVMVNVHSGLGAKGARLLEKHGLPAVVTAWREIAARIPMPTFRQLVLGADDLLNPIPRAPANGVAKGMSNAEDIERITERY